MVIKATHMDQETQEEHAEWGEGQRSEGQIQGNTSIQCGAEQTDLARKLCQTLKSSVHSGETSGVMETKEKTVFQEGEYG